jgi:hypothetical protein
MMMILMMMMVLTRARACLCACIQALRAGMAVQTIKKGMMMMMMMRGWFSLNGARADDDGCL